LGKKYNNLDSSYAYSNYMLDFNITYRDGMIVSIVLVECDNYRNKVDMILSAFFEGEILVKIKRFNDLIFIFSLDKIYQNNTTNDRISLLMNDLENKYNSIGLSGIKKKRRVFKKILMEDGYGVNFGCLVKTY